MGQIWDEGFDEITEEQEKFLEEAYNYWKKMIDNDK
jgi:hypothetical protein